ncbi:MAG: type II toxin-antitoxin system HicB family antitoxin [Salinisphaera sp.]|nr:type II toxin-antitoxin system HicB family antitoxin [Salinisphaera sp.]
MINLMNINGYDAVIQYDPEIKLFRGEFTCLNGGADFYADSIEALEAEGAKSLEVFLQMCAEDGVEPRRQFSGKFMVRVPPKVHALATEAAAAKGVSLNQWVQQTLEREARE